MTSPPAAPTLARRLTRRTLDLLVVAFLAMVGLSVGQQLAEWWRADSPAVTADLSDLTGVDLDWSRTPVTVRFGESPTSLERIPFNGGYKELDEMLINIGKSIVNSTNPSVASMEESERDWLRVLQSSPPVFWDSNQGNIYRLKEPLPSFVATRFVEPEEHGSSQRIVGWGMAFPVSPVTWTIYVFHPESMQREPAESTPAFAPPRGSENITDLRGQDGCHWHVIQGRGDVVDWVQHFNSAYGADSSVSHVITAETTSLKYRKDGIATDIQIRRESDGHLTGVIWSSNEKGPK